MLQERGLLQSTYLKQKLKFSGDCANHLSPSVHSCARRFSRIICFKKKRLRCTQSVSVIKTITQIFTQALWLTDVSEVMLQSLSFFFSFSSFMQQHQSPQHHGSNSKLSAVTLHCMTHIHTPSLRGVLKCVYVQSSEVASSLCFICIHMYFIYLQ